MAESRHRFTAMKPLPERPDFPVLGLSDSFDGFRWLLLWQRRDDPGTGDVTEVDFAHGHPDDGPFIVIKNVLKQAVRGLGDGASRGPIGLAYVASGLVLNAVEISGVDARRHDAALATELQLLEESTDGGAVLNDWHVEAMSIDGVDVEARVRDIGDARVTVLDFSAHVVGVVGPARSLSSFALTDVSARLNAYRAGTDQWADSLLSQQTRAGASHDTQP